MSINKWDELYKTYGGSREANNWAELYDTFTPKPPKPPTLKDKLIDLVKPSQPGGELKTKQLGQDKGNLLPPMPQTPQIQAPQMGRDTMAPIRLPDPGMRIQTNQVEPGQGMNPLLYAGARAVSSTIEKPAYALTEGLLRVLRLPFSEGQIYDALTKQIENYSNVGERGFFTAPAEKERERLRQKLYEKGTTAGIIGDMAETAIDLIGLFIQMSIIKKTPTQFLKISPKLTQLGRQLGTMAGHAVATTPGGGKDRLKAATYRIAYNITPHIANATGAVGLKATFVDTLLNSFLTSPEYIRVINEAGGLNEQSLSFIIPQLVMDIGMAWNTRGLPQNQLREQIKGEWIKSQVEMGKPESQARAEWQTKGEDIVKTVVKAQEQIKEPVELPRTEQKLDEGIKPLLKEEAPLKTEPNASTGQTDVREGIELQSPGKDSIIKEKTGDGMKELESKQFKNWFKNSKVVDDSGKPKQINGVYVKHTENLKTDIPKDYPVFNKLYEYGFELGKNSEKYSDLEDYFNYNNLPKDIDKIIYGDNIDVANRIATMTAIRSGFRDGQFKDPNMKYGSLDFVIAERIGKVPEALRSKNFRDNTFENGVSVLGYYEKGEYVDQNSSSFRMFNSGDVHYVFGLKPYFSTGSDGEALLLYPVDLGKKGNQIIKAKDIKNLGGKDPRIETQKEVAPTVEAVKAPVIKESKVKAESIPKDNELVVKINEIKKELPKDITSQPIEKQIETIEKRIPAQEIPKIKTVSEAIKLDYTPDSNKEIANYILDNVKLEELKDVGNLSSYFRDINRIVSDTFGGNIYKGKSTLPKELILDPFDKAKGEVFNLEKRYTDELKKNVTDLGIKKDTKESALLMDFGEGKITLEQLKSQRPKDWQNFVEADKWFRKAYNDLLDQVNKVRQEVYPGNTDKVIEKREDYYRHFVEMGDEFAEIRKMIDTPAQIGSSIAGSSEFLRPKEKWLSFAQERKGATYKKDAVAGFLNYLNSASYSINITPHIARLQAFTKEIANRTEDTKALNNLITILTRHEQALAGKTHIADRMVQEMVGRNVFRIVNLTNNRVRKNTIVGNMSTLLAQSSHLPMMIGVGKEHSLVGVRDAFKTFMGNKNDPIKQSNFIKERYDRNTLYSQFDTKIAPRITNEFGQLLENADRIITTMTWHTMYNKGISEGIKDPVKYADDVTRTIVAGRGIGEVPYGLQSQMSRLFIPFQVEVSNIVQVHRDLWRGDKAGLAMLVIASFMLNSLTDKIAGRRYMPDPIKAAWDIGGFWQNDELDTYKKLVKSGGRVAGEVVASLPGGQHIASALVSDRNKRRELFGKDELAMYGSGLVSVEGVKDPLFKLLPPMGGGQLKKTINAARAISKGGVDNRTLTDDLKLKAAEKIPMLSNVAGNVKPPQLRFPVSKDPINIIQGLTLGTGGFREGKKYYGEDAKPLSEAQTKEYQRRINNGEDAAKVYQHILNRRRIEAIDREITTITKDKKLTQEQKIKRREKLMEEKKELQKEISALLRK